MSPVTVIVTVACLQTLNLSRKVKTTNYTVEDLEPDVEYEFRVSAENNIGTSEPTVSNPLKYGQSRFYRRRNSRQKYSCNFRRISSLSIDC